jgi:hypothetical protein
MTLRAVASPPAAAAAGELIITIMLWFQSKVERGPRSRTPADDPPLACGLSSAEGEPIILAESLVWAAVLGMTEPLGYTVIGVDIDEDGIIPAALETALLELQASGRSEGGTPARANRKIIIIKSNSHGT